MTEPSANADKRSYHHGDLPRAIVMAALEILSETQSMDFSLRELARRAGVSHNAPYKHFADKRELLAAVSAAGFDLLAKRIVAEIADVSGAEARLFAAFRAYVRQGVENPALYRLMFGGYLSEPDDRRPAVERAAAEKTKSLFEGAIVAGAFGRPIPETPRNEGKIAGTLLVCWSLMHGLTLLLADGLVGPREEFDEFAEVVMRAALDGLGSKYPILPPGTWVGPQARG